MNIFINDVFIRLVSSTEIVPPDKFNNIINCGVDSITQANLIHHVWIKNPRNSDIDDLLALLDSTVSRTILTITITSNQFEPIKAYFKSKFKIMKAAGGVIKKGTKILMIRRLKKWDLPKGKIDKGETPQEAAVREVEEECSVTVELGQQICKTWHTYTMKKNLILKKTSWYAMKLVDDSEMSPQTEEDIEDIKWMSPKEMFHALDDSYRSIQFVISEYRKGTAKRKKVKTR